MTAQPKRCSKLKFSTRVAVKRAEAAQAEKVEGNHDTVRPQGIGRESIFRRDLKLSNYGSTEQGQMGLGTDYNVNLAHFFYPPKLEKS